MLATLYAKALDADNPASVLGDHWAGDVVRQIDYDWSTTTITARNAASVTLRSAHFDTWTRQFLAVHPQAVVLHLGCGLDSRYFRVAPGDGVDWYDVDYPEVAALREQLLSGDVPTPCGGGVGDRSGMAELASRSTGPPSSSPRD